MATGFKGFDTIDELQAAIDSRPAVEALRMFTTQEITELLQTVVKEFANSDGEPEVLMRLVCEALEVDFDEVINGKPNAD